MSRFDAKPYLEPLAGFQRATVEHVIRRLYIDADRGRRFLVADETGLGKSMVARGVVAKVIEQLQDEPSVKRIDIVYVCSNADIAKQNVKRLDVIGQHHAVASRLTLLARDGRALDGATAVNGKAVNLVSFTPGTLPGGWQTGIAEERALIHVLLAQAMDLDRGDRRASLRLFQGGVQRLETMQWWVDGTCLLAQQHGGFEPRIASEFFAASARAGLTSAFETYIDRVRPIGRVPSDIQHEVRNLVGRLRTELARASVHALEPDLLILDEFQRFRDLITPDPEKRSEAAELAQALFDFPDARVLLLSATPIKAFTYAEEIAAGDDHERDLAKILRFLADGSPTDPARITADLAEFRRLAISGAPVADARDRVRAGLLKVMARTERPRVGVHGMLAEEQHPVQVDASDLAGWVGLRRLAEDLTDDSNRVPMSLEHWKSAPYFANFLDGYKFGDHLKARIKSGRAPEALAEALAGLQMLDAAVVEARGSIELGSARLRQLSAMTLGRGLHELLWVPPSLPYLEPDGPYAGIDSAAASKQLIFSSWSATPTAVASLLSYQADRALKVPEADLNRLTYAAPGERAGRMTTLVLLWPNPRLAELCDPLAFAGLTGGPVNEADAVGSAIERVGSRLPQSPISTATAAEVAYWEAALGSFGPPPLQDAGAIAAAMTGGGDADVEQPMEEDGSDGSAETPRLLQLHIDLALKTSAGAHIAEQPHDLAEVVARIGMHAPGNIAWRSLRRITGDSSQVSEVGLWGAAAVLASGFRSLFNRAEAIGLLDEKLAGRHYWQAVLIYCGWGNLQSVLDEHLHHLAIAEGFVGDLDDEKLMILARRVRATLALRPSRYSAYDPHNPDNRVGFVSRFALRYGTARQSDVAARLPEIRNAFNSPFWPWVLASTSVGQEGIDFHWWCHSIVHWNTPASPVDFEQREGRVNRYGGLAIRRNLAHRHGSQLLQGEGDPWKLAYELGKDARGQLGELAPHWVYPGPVQIRRTVLPYPLSVDGGRYRRIKDDLTLYRLTFGQPRQEDLLDVLRRRGVQQDEARLAELTLDLKPPSLRSDDLLEAEP